MPEGIDKARVAASFSRAAKSYDACADLQRRVGHALLERWREKLCYIPEPQGRPLLDLGCGTGYFHDVLKSSLGCAQVVSLDMAPGMLVHAQCDRRLQSLVCGDAERLPLLSQSVSAVFSNFSLQWCHNLLSAFSEACAALVPGGYFACALPGPDTLSELRKSWARVDADHHVNYFHSVAEVDQLLRKAGFQIELLDRVVYTLEYQNFRCLAGELKGVGAHNVNHGRPLALTGKARIRAVEEAYEYFRNERGLLPASYEVIFVIAKTDKVCEGE